MPFFSCYILDGVYLCVCLLEAVKTKVLYCFVLFSHHSFLKLMPQVDC